MKKGEKPAKRQTRTLRALIHIGKRIKILKKRSAARQLHEEEEVELITLAWVKNLLKTDEGWTDCPKGLR